MKRKENSSMSDAQTQTNVCTKFNWLNFLWSHEESFDSFVCCTKGFSSGMLIKTRYVEKVLGKNVQVIVNIIEVMESPQHASFRFLDCMWKVWEYLNIAKTKRACRDKVLDLAKS